jgi:riboflavin kinase/FMN adenylyltransferase
MRRVPVRAEQPVALTIGNFDGLHLGHRTMLARLVAVARARDLAAAVMTFEPQPQEFFAPDQAPARLTSLREKLELLRAVGIDIAFVCHFDYRMAQIPAEEFVDLIVRRALDTRWLLVGDDFRFGARRGGDFDLLMSLAPRYGYEVEATHSVLHKGTRVSSTAVRACLQAGDLDGAAQLLGRVTLFAVASCTVTALAPGLAIRRPMCALIARNRLWPVFSLSKSMVLVSEAGRQWPASVCAPP